jgi:hypothetical protein
MTAHRARCCAPATGLAPRRGPRLRLFALVPAGFFGALLWVGASLATAPEPALDEREAEPSAPPACEEPVTDDTAAATPREHEAHSPGPDVRPEAAVAPAEPQPLDLDDAALVDDTAAAADGRSPRPSAVDAARDPRAPIPEEPPWPPPLTGPLEAPAQGRLGFGGVPALNYDADNGFGFGFVGTLFWYEPDVLPYRYALTFQVFATSKLVQDHQIRFDAVDLFRLPLRFTFRGGYFQTVTHNFCGFGSEVQCDPAEAKREAAREGLLGEESEQFERRYYKVRFVRPYAQTLFRWGLNKKPHLVEIMAGWRGDGYLHGDPWEDADGDGAPDLAFHPYPNSLYQKTFPVGEPGFASVLTFGVMVDDRDNEPAPTRGYWVEASVRAAAGLIGSTWDYLGANVTLRGYVPLLPGSDRLVLAERLIFDVTAGDLPVQEMVRVGGSWDYTAFGGNPMGRGIRLQRYIGRLKALGQTELRYAFIEHGIFAQHLRWSVVALLDHGWIGYDWNDLRGAPLRLALGVGGGLRVAWNHDFVVRLDVATSRDEGGAPAVYLDIGHPF